MSALSRKALRGQLIAAGILTEFGDVSGAEFDHPDAALLAAIARHELRWNSYSEMRRRSRLTPSEKAARQDHYFAGDQARDLIVLLAAKTSKGARAKAEWVAKQFGPYRGKPYGGMYSHAASALRDALRGPVFFTSDRRGHAKRRQEIEFSAANDDRLLAVLDEYKEVRRRARPDDLWGRGPDPETLAALYHMMALEADITRTPAITWPGIYAKLQATTPSAAIALHWAPLRSAIIDVLEVGL
jgi:hypothetical protein